MPMKDFACAPFILQPAQMTKPRTNVHGGFAGKGREFLASSQHSDQHTGNHYYADIFGWP